VTRSGLLTDAYEITMAGSYIRRGMTTPASFSLFVRQLPHTRGFLVLAGVDEACRFLEEFRFDEDDLVYLEDSMGLPAEILDALRQLRFSGEVWSAPEGSIVTADEPLLEVTAPLPEAQLVETALLNLMTFQTTIASKAARCRLAAADRHVVDFSFRRTQGLESGLLASRSAAIAGFDATSNVAAARLYELGATGTMAHSYVQAFPREVDAFRAFAADYPDRAAFLVDTYDTADGVRSAIEVVHELGDPGPLWIRLDSGDLGALARTSRQLLDAARLTEARIIASGGLDEHEIERLLAENAPIDAFGVGTKMGVSADAPYLDTVYKLVAYGGRPVMKLSTGKRTLPGPKQVFRRTDGDLTADVLGLREEPIPDGYHPMMACVMRGGARVAPVTRGEAVRAARARCAGELAHVPPQSRRLADPTPLVVRLSSPLAALAAEVARGLGVPAL